jgi:hypothetical protein
MPADRESCELLRAIAWRPIDALQRIHELAARVRDWDSLLEIAQEHRMAPMLFSRLISANASIPPATQDRLQAEHHRNAFHSLANAAELINLLKAFEQEEIPAMPFKGVVLGASVYRDLTVRPAGDLDLLIHYRNLKQATAILLKRGYELITPSQADGSPAWPTCYEYRFERKGDGMVIELRWRLELTQPRFRQDLGMDWVWPARQVAMLAGAEVPDLSPEIALLVLCMHGSKHLWSRLIWICDVAQLLISCPDLDWRKVNREAKRVGLWRALALGVLLAHRVAGAAVPETVLLRYESDAAASRLAQHIEESLFETPGSSPTGSIPYYTQLLSLHDRIRLLLSLDFLRPNDRDRAVVPLPKSLQALYYLIRPFRLLFDKSARN